MGLLEGKTVIVTGAGRGLGRSIAQAAGVEGARLALVDIDEENLSETVVGLKEHGSDVMTLPVDITNRSQWQTAINQVAKAFGRIDVLVNNAMWIRYEPLAEVQPETLSRMMAVGFEATFWGIQAVAPHMAALGKGSIINMSSPASVHGFAGAAVYCSVKGAISAFTRQCAAELGPKGIRVNAIAPGPTRTPGAMNVVDEEGWKRRLQRSPLGRLSTPEGIARIAVFLASDESDCVSGDVIFGDGGRSIAAY